jgi:hypothetical protein
MKDLKQGGGYLVDDNLPFSLHSIKSAGWQFAIAYDFP